jgi:membrane protein required for colicin V production
MTWLDGAFLLLIFLLSFLGFRRGIVHIIVIISSYSAGVIAAVMLAGYAGEILSGYAEIPDAFARIIAAAAVFIITVLLIRGAGWLLKKIVSLALPGIDKACGLVFGIVLAVILIAICSIFLYISPLDSKPGMLYDDSFTPKIVMKWLDALSPDGSGSTGEEL